MSNGRIDWRDVLNQLIIAAIPIVMKWILDWLTGATTEDVVALGDKAGKAYNAFRNA